ncbi:MAG: META domain-containing protein [Phenylobacterium sp.]
MRLFREAVFVAAALALGGCESWNEGADLSAPLAGTNWRLVELVSKSDAVGSVRPSDPWKYQMSLAADGTVHARLDCNRGVGSWSTIGPPVDQMTFAPMAMTRAMCPEGSLDTRIAQELSAVSSYEHNDDRLVLYLTGDRGDQVWARVRE